MSKKKKNLRRIRQVEIVNVHTGQRKLINLGDECVIFDEKSGTHLILPVKKPTYEIDDTEEKEK